ncbi:hypothetical protein [Mycolicibacterium sp.]|uniref:hypothetical protein n=1 Tax=Mycolicibacterium sp. TaxID=2320850 RepID=UPI0037C94335
MTTNLELLIEVSSRQSAQQIAEAILAAMGASQRQIREATSHNAATEAPAFEVPLNLDYPGFDSGQNLPAGVRVYGLPEGERVVMQFPSGGETMVSARKFSQHQAPGNPTHLAYIVSGSDQSALANITRGIDHLHLSGWKIHEVLR